MTEDDAKHRAVELIGDGNMIEAGFILILLRHAPADVPADEVAAYRRAFFCGARYMFDLLHMPVAGDDAVGDMLDKLLAELTKFGKSRAAEGVSKDVH